MPCSFPCLQGMCLETGANSTAAPASLFQISILKARDLDGRWAKFNGGVKDVVVKKEEIAEIRRLLDYMEKTDARYDRAQKILAGFKDREKETKRQARVAFAKAAEPDVAGRMKFIKQLDRKLLDAGRDFALTLAGPKKNILNIRYVLMSRPLVHKIINETLFVDLARGAGFISIDFNDGYDNRWTYDLLTGTG